MSRSNFGFASVLLFPILVAACGAGSDTPVPNPNPDDPPAPVDPKADDDHDGVPNDRDLCPGTRSGATVDKNGCSAEQREHTTTTTTTTGGSTTTTGNGGAGGAGGSTTGTGGSAGTGTGGAGGGDNPSNGFTTIVLDPHGAHPMVFRTLKQNVTTTSTGTSVKGTLLLQAPGGANLPIVEADVSFEYGTRAEDGFQRVRGSAEVPLPALGFLDKLVETKAPMASIGFDTGEHLSSLDAPLAADRKYLYFTYSTELSATAGPVTIAAPGGKSMTAVLDPSDPFFFVRTNVDGLGSMKSLKEVGLGVSMQGNIPFAPSTTWGLPAGIGQFNGHLYVEATAPLKVADLPLELKGQMVMDLDPDHDKVTPFLSPAAPTQVGANGQLDVSVDIVDGIASFQFPLGNASFGAKLAGKNQSVYLSGILHPDTPFLPEAVPVASTGDARVAGLVDRANLSASFFRAEAEMKVNASRFGALTGLTLNDISAGSARLSIDHSGFIFHGTTRQGIHPLVGVANQLDIDAFFSGKPTDWYIGLAGDMSVAGVGLSGSAKAVVGPAGIHVTGTYATPIAAIAMAGDITRSGANIEGTTSITIPIVAGKEVLQQITDAVICGTEMVTDSALCGTTIVKDATMCGVHAVTDSALCGSRYVTDAALCGSSYVTSAAACGTHAVTDGAKCGFSYFSDALHCGWDCVASIFTKCSCSIANTCNIDNSCWAPNSCSIANTCSIANECSVAATCPQAKTCDHKVTIPDFDFGSFKAQVHVRIGTSGLAGDVEGDYCATGGSCTKLVGGRIDVSGAPKACITVPGLGEFCGAF